MGIEGELLEKSSRNGSTSSQETSKNVAIEPKVEQVTPEQVLRRSSRTI